MMIDADWKVARFELTKPKTETITIRMSKDLLKGIKDEAKKLGLDYQKFMRIMMENHRDVLPTCLGPLIKIASKHSLDLKIFKKSLLIQILDYIDPLARFSQFKKKLGKMGAHKYHFRPTPPC